MSIMHTCPDCTDKGRRSSDIEKCRPLTGTNLGAQGVAQAWIMPNLSKADSESLADSSACQ